jgi:hypothetical protein
MYGPKIVVSRQVLNLFLLLLLLQPSLLIEVQMDSHENGWEDLTGLALESTQRSPTTGPVDMHTGPTPNVALNGAEVRSNEEETGIGNGGTELTSWDWGLKQLKRVLGAAKGVATSQVVDFIKEQ